MSLEQVHYILFPVNRTGVASGKESRGIARGDRGIKTRKGRGPTESGEISWFCILEEKD